MDTKTGILIVDDDPGFRKTLSGILRARGYAPIATATGKAALDRIEEEMFAVALIDLRLEDISGLELMGKIKERCPGTECIVLTGYASQESAIEAVNLGAYSYVQKPYDMEQLMVTIRRAVEKRAAEEALRESEEKYRTILENIEDSYYEVDIAGNFTFFNDSLCRLLGYSEDELMGMNNREYMDDENPKKIYQTFNAVYRTGKPAEAFDWEVIRKDGTRRFVEASVSLIRDSAGEPAGFQGIARDITERKRAEESLREERDRAQRYLDVAGVMFVVIDADQSVSLINRRGCEILGREEEEIVGKNWFGTCVPERLKDEVKAVFDRLMDGEVEPVEYYENPVVTKDGEERIIAWHNTLLTDDIGNTIGTLSSGEDITERKRVEERVRRLLDQQIAANQLALTLGETRDLDEVYHTIYEHVRMLMDAEAFIVSFYDDETQLIRAGYVVSEGTVRDIGHFPPIPLEEEGYGTQSQVIRTGQPFYVPDFRKAMERTRTEYKIAENGTVSEGPPPPEEKDIARSALYVPMKIEGETIGMMQVQSYRLDAYSQEDIDLLSALANVAAIAIQNTRLYEETRSRAERLAVVNRIARAVGATLHLDDLMETVYREVTSVFQADAFFIALYDREANELDFRLRVDEGVREPRERRPLGTGLTALVVSEKKPILIRDFEKEKDNLPEIGLWGTMKAPPSWLGAPMLVGEQLIGVICVQAYHPYAYGEEEKLLLSTIADQVAVAIEQARLYEAEREQRELAEALEAAAAAVSSTLEPDQVLDRILEEVERVVAGDAFNFMLIEDDTAQVIRSRGYERLGVEEQISRFAMPVVELNMLHMVQTGEPVVIPDTSTDPDWVPLEGWEWLRSYVGAPFRVGGVTAGVLSVDGTRPGQFGPADAHRLEAFADHAAAAIENARLFEQAQQEIAERKRAQEELQHTLERLRKALGGIIQAVALTVEVKDPYTAGHQRRVGNLARAIANEMGLPQEQIDGIRMAGLIHDLGKVGIPAEILSKPGQLSDFDWGIIKMHSQIGYDILKTVDFPWPVAQIVLQHHERMDGSGYPQGLSGEEILLEARILAVADVVEAMSSHRPYRPARGIDKALEEISQNRGVLYDAEAVDACLKLFTEKGFEFE